MLLAVALWAGVIIVIAIIKGDISLTSDFGLALTAFTVWTVVGIMVSVVPTIIGAKALSIWLQHSKVTQKSAIAAGAITGAISISLLTVPISIFMLTTELSDFAYSQSAISLFVSFDLPIATCAALAGGRTGFQLAKFIEIQKQKTVESGQDLFVPTQTQL